MKEKIIAEAANIETTIDTWFQKMIHGTVVQRDDVLHTRFHAAKEELKTLLMPTKTTKAEKSTSNEETK